MTTAAGWVGSRSAGIGVAALLALVDVQLLACADLVQHAAQNLCSHDEARGLRVDLHVSSEEAHLHGAADQ